MSATCVTGREQSPWWVISDYFEMTKRSLRHIVNDPEQLATVSLQPILTLVIMRFFIGGAIQAGTRQNYLDFVLPGIFIVMAGFAAVTTALSVASDMQQGVIDRFRTLPMAKSAVVAGHVISDLPRAVIGLAVTIGIGVLIGFRSHAGPGAWGAAVGLTLLATFALSWIAAVIGLLGSSVEVTQQLAALVIVPVFLSSALVPTGTMPAWLGLIAANQPLSQAIDAIRALLSGTPASGHLELALTELTGVIVVGFVLETLLFKRKTTLTSKVRP